MDIQAQWFPGHMAKTLRLLKEQVKLVDVVVEIVDARLPLSSRNPELKKFCHNKKHIVLLNKSDLADKSVSQAWLNYYAANGQAALLFSCKDRQGLGKLEKLIMELTCDIREQAAERGWNKRPIRVMVMGVPNCGKSTFINTLVGRKSAVTENRPGVTRANKWIKSSNNNIEWLDTPGLLWPKIELAEQRLNLALAGSIPEAILDRETIVFEAFKLLWQRYAPLLAKRYKLDPEAEFSNDLFDQAVGNHGCLRAGRKLDYERFAKAFLNDFRSSALGAISLEETE